ncbi:MAG: exodeoxyribonuclease III [Candidatus Nomurabacteria bacterium]|nr:exodeoxyribonuclease III [Candidatus Nomurabacteria bacterium]
MKILSWNVNGIRSVHDKNLFQPLIDEQKPDIICLQETKAHQHQSPVDLPDYDEYWNSAQRPGYSGTAIFSKEKPLNISFGFSPSINKKYELTDGFGDLTAEGRVMTAEYPDFYLVNVYTPNSKRSLERLDLRSGHWDPAFLEHCKKLNKKKPVVMCGDFNAAHTEIDLARPKDNKKNAGFTELERAGIDNLINSGFIDTFRMFTHDGGHYSWWSNFAGSRARNIGWRIDYFFASDTLKSKIKKAEILPDVMGSDHCPVTITFEL